MPLKKSHGNMYDWVTHVHSHLGGMCPHQCSYCYVQNNRFGVSKRYKGQPRLLSYELDVDYGSGKIIFVEHMNDMFAESIRSEWIKKIFGHCLRYPFNHYVFQTKNPERAWEFYKHFPCHSLIGTTIETNRDISKFSNAPATIQRYKAIYKFAKIDFNTFITFDTFVTIEPIMDFDVDILSDWICKIRPEFINIGADSKNCNLPEPSAEKVKELIYRLQIAGITIKKKINLTRLLNRQEFLK